MPRLWEIDALRTFAIVLMVVYHAAYDVRMLDADVGPDVYRGWWKALQVACASTFLTVVGMAAWIRSQAARARGLTAWEAWRRDLPRSLQIAAAAGVVSVATFVALGTDGGVRFGILHLIALAVLFVLPFAVRLGALNAVLAAAFVIGGALLDQAPTDVGVLMVVGLDPGETGSDWVPIVPWLGMPLLGVAIGAWLYPDGTRGPLVRRLAEAPRHAGAIGAPGRRSLTIYLVHQPVLIALAAGVLLV